MRELLLRYQEFLSTLSLRRATCRQASHARRGVQGFLSTLSLRRATNARMSRTVRPVNFYPRSPCGERRRLVDLCRSMGNFYPRSPCGERPGRCGRKEQGSGISIHALLAESDAPDQRAAHGTSDFYPRSPCGERPADCAVLVHLYDFYPRSPCGERQVGKDTYKYRQPISIHALLAESDTTKMTHCWQNCGFLSTLSLRRATL